MTGEIEVELHQPPDYVSVGRLPLAPLLREFFEAVLGRPLPSAKFLLHLVSVDDREPIPGYPTMVNLRGGFGYGEVTILDSGRVVYQHPHTVNEIVGGPLQRRLAHDYPGVDHWGYGLVGQGLERLTLERPVPLVTGGVGIRAAGGRRRPIHMEQIPDAEPAPRTLAALGVDGPRSPSGGPREADPRIPVSVVMSPAAYSALTDRAFSKEVEEGGFLIGHRHADGEHPGRDLLEVTAVADAESTGASLLRFTFTGESFLQLANLLARRGAHEEILGWYHTHLFAATPTFGLSTVDVRLHSSTFRRSWQVAALVNLGHEGRTLRCFGSLGGSPDSGMIEVPYWAVGPSAAPSLAHAAAELEVRPADNESTSTAEPLRAEP
jgi:hypothetical protein